MRRLKSKGVSKPLVNAIHKVSKTCPRCKRMVQLRSVEKHYAKINIRWKCSNCGMTIFSLPKSVNYIRSLLGAFKFSGDEVEKRIMVSAIVRMFFMLRA